MAERSKELIQVAYFLSKFGKKEPPKRLNTEKWNYAYRMFYDKLNGGRPLIEFEHSLKNSRDAFDSYFNETNREGWKIKGTLNPAPLTGYLNNVFVEFKNRNEIDIWNIIKKYVDLNYLTKDLIFNDLISEDTSNSNSNLTKTEGGVKVRISKTIERNTKMRQVALEIHGYKCQVCSFDFEYAYGDWGKNFAEVHHIKPLAELKGKEQQTNPKIDLAVLCANCHRMVHRKKGITLTVDELQNKIRKK